MRTSKIVPVFVEFIPTELESNCLYISIDYKIMAHKCACGCGNIIYTPIDRKDGWVLSYDGESVTIKPSIGNWNLKCRSHYYIIDNYIDWITRRTSSEAKKKTKKLIFFHKKRIKEK